jgi:dCTP deaminase
MTLIEIFLALICHGGVCHVDRIYVTPEAMAIASCESGDGYHFGTYDFTARNKVTGRRWRMAIQRRNGTVDFWSEPRQGVGTSNAVQWIYQTMERWQGLATLGIIEALLVTMDGHRGWQSDYEGGAMILNDEQIRQRMADGMIDGGALYQVRNDIISYGVTSFGYDMRCADEWQVWERNAVATIDPKRNDLHKHLTPRSHITSALRPATLRCACSVEYFVNARRCHGRGRRQINVCPLWTHRQRDTARNQAWRGHVAIELSNTAPLPIKVYANEGIAQVMFFQGERPKNHLRRQTRASTKGNVVLPCHASKERSSA